MKNRKNKTEPESFSFSNTNKRKHLHRYRELLFNLLWHWKKQNQELMWRRLYPHFTQWVVIMGAAVAQGVEVFQSAYRSNSEQDTEPWVSPNKEIEVWVCPKRRTRHFFLEQTLVWMTLVVKSTLSAELPVYYQSMLSRVKLSVLVCEIRCCKCKKQWVSLSVTDVYTHTHDIYWHISTNIFCTVGRV